MAKKGGTYHTKRIAIPKVIPISNKKASKFMMTTAPGPHQKNKSVPLGVLLRDVLGVTKSAAETRKVLNGKQVFVDGTMRRDERFPIGIMDSVSIPKAEKAYRIVVNKKGQLVPVEAKGGSKKIAKITGKNTVKGGKINVTLHDGRNILADNKLKVGDSVIVSVPKTKIEKVLKLDEGAKCLITDGKHAGTIATLQKIIEREGEYPEAKLKGAEEFITLAKYLFVVDDSYEGA